MRQPRISRRCRETLRTVLACAALTCMVGGVVAGTATADDVSDQKRKVEQIADQLDDIANQVGQLDEDYGAAQDTKAQLDIEIAASQAKVDEQQAQLDALQSTITLITIERYTSGTTTQLSPLFADPSEYSDAQQRDELNRMSLDSGAGDVDEAQSLALDLAEEKQILERKQQQAADLVATLERQTAEATRLEAEYKERYDAAKVELGDLIQQEQERRAAEAIAEANEIARQQAAAQAAKEQAEAAAAARAREAAARTATAATNRPANGGASSAVAAPANTTAPARGGGAPAGGDDDEGSTGAASPPAASPPAANPPAPSGGDDGGSAAPPASSLAGVVVSAAYSQLGVPYRFAAESPGTAFDCSGLTKWAWGKAGVSLPHQSGQQYASIPHVSRGDIQPGDLIFYHAPIGHVAIYIGGGQLIHAPRTGDVVKVSTVNWGSVVGIGRPG